MTATDKDTTRGPHQSIATDSPREQFAAQLFDQLWERYRRRVVYVRQYEQVVADAGATFVNDHIALRTFANQSPLTGIASVSRTFEALGYYPLGCYAFPTKNLSAIHFQHANPQFPKIFISELKVWELDPSARRIVAAAMKTHRAPLDMEMIARMASLDQHSVTPEQWRELLDNAVIQFHRLPWDLPAYDDMMALNAVSQYAAWVLVHGYNVNHFTSLINSHKVAALDDIEKTSSALQAAGVPMKAEIEGQRGSKLRQTATEAVMIDVDVMRGGQMEHVPWSYAYFELAERGSVTDPETGRATRFEGFLGPQATNLFEMTRVPRQGQSRAT